MHAPKKSHYEKALHVVNYVKNHPELGLLMSSTSAEDIVAYCDSDWASCPMSWKSVTGFCIKLGASHISWKAKKKSTISRSSVEAKYRSMEHTVAELIWLKGLLKELQVNVKMPMELYCPGFAIAVIAEMGGSSHL
uniref:Uncharacterized mitochondrial protein AtMg00810-like n=1 Tax=Nicotiana tabacum TaxID=4097 RepID=A0A1S3XBB3_TOBAC|nr:PREDICTED: uncharacterized mitochondrial protein AtMg00810-like [Nicotiana tabacum]